MPSLFDEIAAVASSVLVSLGQTITWSHDNDDGVFNPVTGIEAGRTQTAYTGSGIISDFKTNRIGTQILATDKRFIMDAKSIPEANDIVLVNGTNYQVIAFKEVNPSGTAVIYELQLRS